MSSSNNARPLGGTTSTMYGSSPSSSSSSRSAKRRRVRRPPAAYNNSSNNNTSSMTAAEERFLLQQAMLTQNSKDGSRALLNLPYGPTFFPTIAEFQGNPLHYIEKIRPVAERYGICKIVPPVGWNPAPFCIQDDVSNMSDPTIPRKRFQTKLQQLSRLQEGISFGDGHDYSVAEYQEMASKFTKEWKAKHYPDHDLLSRHHAQVLQEQQQAAAAAAASASAAAAAANLKEDPEAPHDKTNEGVGKSDVTDPISTSHNTDAKRFTPENLERDYWELVETNNKDAIQVEYGNDVETSAFGSGFPLSDRGRSVCKPITDAQELKRVRALPEPKFGTPEFYKETYWNLNNIPAAPDSAIRHLKVGINGINIPWMYYGSLFTTFCWHNEDNYMYSINYHHRGAPKQWYGVPGSKEAADGLEKVFKSYLSMKMREVPDLLHHITTMFSPRLLQNANVPVCRLLQYEGEFIVTFPRAFHGGFSYGPNAGEAVNFATHDWIYYGADANERYRSFARPAVFSHDRLTFTIAHHLNMQKAYSTCKLLLEELERVVQEELKRRAELSKAGVRDVSSLIKLPKNRLDQLDERSAAYDDKRLCHACRHICFFSAVACECSQSKVSCLRHSHYMCRCPTHKKYFMIWSPNEELQATLERVRAHCNELHKRAMNADGTAASAAAAAAMMLLEATPLPEFAVGSKEDQELHKDDEISTGLFLGPTYQPIRSIAWSLESAQNNADDMTKAISRVVSDTSSTAASSLSSNQSSPQNESAVCVAAPDDDDDDDEVEVIGVVRGRGLDC